MKPPTERSLVAWILADPARMKGLALSEWDLLLRQARCSDLVARLAALTRLHLAASDIPPEVQVHLQAALTVQRAQALEVDREAGILESLLMPLGIPVVMLKGSAYLLSRGPASLGRTLTDIDFLVPRESLPEVESALLIHGWHTTHPDPYDQLYYRKWMHELPPLVHARRGTALDVHHAILPPTSRAQVDTRLILESAERVPRHELLSVPCAADQVLHSVVHLMFNEDLRHGLRDLSDIHLMLLHHGRQANFWPALIERSHQLNLSTTLDQGLTQVHQLLGTEIPKDIIARLRRFKARTVTGSRAMGRLWSLALDTHHPSATRPTAHAARALLFLRAHALRMPAPLLARHIAIKLMRRISPGMAAKST